MGPSRKALGVARGKGQVPTVICACRGSPTLPLAPENRDQRSLQRNFGPACPGCEPLWLCRSHH